MGDRHRSVQNASISGPLSTGEEEHVAEVDEPPEHHLLPEQVPYYKVLPSPAFSMSKTSLLTQSLLSGSDMTSGSEAEVPPVTSDGGLTSPARTTTPSPPASSQHRPSQRIKDVDETTAKPEQSTASQGETNATPKQGSEKNLESGLARRRCITFACGGQKKVEPKEAQKVAQSPGPINPSSTKRPCLLKFVCPFKPSKHEKPNNEAKQRSPTPAPALSRRESAPEIVKSSKKATTDATTDATSDDRLEAEVPHPRPASSQLHLKSKSLKDSEAARFHEFGIDLKAQDDWLTKQVCQSKKMTVNDTLRKENALRQIAQEVEEEADDEQNAEKDLNQDCDDEDGGEEDDLELQESDDGNESDDEGGFGDSDGESDYWSPAGTIGATTAATSTDHLDHFRHTAVRLGSNSSVESMIKVRGRPSIGESRSRERRGRRRSPRERFRPGTPDLPDSTDFVCGTFDEDRPLEKAFKSCIEDRQRSKKPALPQDVDPTFPTSDSDMDEEDEFDDDDDVANNDSADDHWNGPLAMSDEDASIKQNLTAKPSKSPVPSPKRPRSPAPVKRTMVHRSPPPLRSNVHRSPPPLKRTASHRSPVRTKAKITHTARPAPRLFGKSPEQMWSPTKFRRHLHSPPSTRLTSPHASPARRASLFEPNTLAHRPHLTHTASMPRTPNPFWLRHGGILNDSSDTVSGAIGSRSKHRKQSDLHDRGPIDIVQGLEAKRQRRREKYWKQHCRNFKDRRQHPGQGAERMKEVGLLSSERYKGYGPKLQLMLSI